MEQIRTLLWLKFRLSFALYRKRAALLVGLLITLPVALAIMLGLYFGGLVALWGLPAETGRQILNGALTAIYVAWIFGPMFGVSMNEGYDLSKLLLFPVSGRRIFLANTLGAVMDKTVLFLLVPLACVPVALGAGIGKILIVLVLFLFLFHTVSLSQALLTLMWGLLRSRRVADFWKVFVGLAGTIFWVAYQIAFRRMERVMPAVLMMRPRTYTRFLPSGLAADAVMALDGGDVSAFAWRAAVLALLCAATVALAGGLVLRVTAGELVLDRVGLARPARRARERRRVRYFPACLPPATAAMCQMELRTYWRDPQAKLELLQRVAAVIMWPVILLSSPHENLSWRDIHGFGPFVFLGPMAGLVLMLLVSASNVFARDRHGLSLLFTLPTPRGAIFHGKNLALFAIFTPLSLAMALAAAFTTGAWNLALPAFAVSECLMLLSLSVGNLFSVFTPQPIPEKGRNPYTSGGGCSPVGCLTSVAGFLYLLVLCAPVVLAFLAPAAGWSARSWLFATVPAAVLYSLLAYHLNTLWTANALSYREPEILEAILKTPA